MLLVVEGRHVPRQLLRPQLEVEVELKLEVLLVVVARGSSRGAALE